MKNGQEIGQGFARSRFGMNQEILGACRRLVVGQKGGNGPCLNGGGLVQVQRGLNRLDNPGMQWQIGPGMGLGKQVVGILGTTKRGGRQ